MGHQVYTVTRKPTEADALRHQLEQVDFQFGSVNYAFWQARGAGLTLTFYKSGKLVIQGRNAERFAGDMFSDQQAIHGLESVKNLSSWIGSDESGKGDFFGALVVAAVRVDIDNVKELTMIGVQDCKKLSDARILELAVEIQKLYPVAVNCVMPIDYNEMYKSYGNLNLMLADAHAKVIQELLAKNTCDAILTDQFGNERLMKNALGKLDGKTQLVQQHRAEANPAVAAASVVARAIFLKAMAELSEAYKIDFPKGATHVIGTGKRFVRMHGFDKLNQVAKMHFKTVQKIRG